jgi:hypothetical protein
MAYTTIDDPSKHFQTTLYTGNSSNLTVTNDGNSDLKPDLVWTKKRSDTSHHTLVDSSRGATKQIYANLTAAEETVSGVTAFNTDGFTLGSNGTANLNNATFVAWQWKANGGTTTAFSESGNNPGGNRQTNTDAGFSIISYTGTGANASCALAHGLPSTPEFIIFKRRDNANFWCVWQQAIGDDYKLALQTTDALDADGAFMNSTLPDATNIYVGGTSVNTNANNGTYICYAFSPVQGYSKFGSYEGTSNADGPLLYTGFKPAFVMLKPADINEHWVIHDGTRDPFNKTYHYVFANETEAEAAGGTHHIDLLSNGFKVRTSNNNWNTSSTIIYMAFAESPFISSKGVPTTAR